MFMCKIIKLYSHLTHCTKNQLQLDQRSQSEMRNAENTRRKYDSTLQDTGAGKNILNGTPFIQDLRSTIHNRKSQKLNFLGARETIRQLKRKLTE